MVWESKTDAVHGDCSEFLRVWQLQKVANLKLKFNLVIRKKVLTDTAPVTLPVTSKSDSNLDSESQAAVADFAWKFQVCIPNT